MIACRTGFRYIITFPDRNGLFLEAKHIENVVVH
jgi:hypothetical protein